MVSQMWQERGDVPVTGAGEKQDLVEKRENSESNGRSKVARELRRICIRSDDEDQS